MNKLLKQIINFIGFSGIGWILDFTIYTVLSLLSINLFICNILGAAVGVSFVFLFSTRYIFRNNSKIPLYAKYFLYVTYQIILIYYISKLLILINNILITNTYFALGNDFSAILSKIIITPITMIFNFIILKNIIEKI